MKAGIPAPTGAQTSTGRPAASSATELGALIAAEAQTPPLSIAVFGAWGSGKSFFMRMIQEAAQEFVQTLRRAEQGLAFGICGVLPGPVAILGRKGNRLEVARIGKATHIVRGILR